MSIPRCAGSMSEPQPINARPVGLGFPHGAGRCRPGGPPFLSPDCQSCTCIDIFFIRGWDPILPGVRWIYKRSPANQRSACEAGVSKPCGAVSTRGTSGSSPGCRSCRCMEVFVIRGWRPILPGKRWLYVRAPGPISDRPVGLGFPHRAGRFRGGGSPFLFPGCRSCKGMGGFLIRECKPMVSGWRWIYSRAPANQRSACGLEFGTMCGAVSTRGITVFVPGLSEL